MKATLATAGGLLLAGLGHLYGYGRAAIALAMAGAVLYLGYSYFSAAATVPPDAETEDVSEENLKYVCRMCGLELRVETTTTDRAPTHCREKMELVNTAGPSTAIHPL